MIKRYWKKGFKQKLIVVLASLLLLTLIFIHRDDFQPILLFIRKFLFIILVVLLVLFIGIRSFRKSVSAMKRFFVFLFMVVIFGAMYIIGVHYKMYDYMKTYNVFKDLNLVEINELPLTQNERIQPLQNIFSMANESVGETKDVSLPHLVRVDGQNKWTMAIQPSEKYTWQRINDNTEELFAVSSTSPFPRFSNENRISTVFSIGESLKFSRRTYNAAVKRLSFWKLCNYQPGDVFYLKNDNNEWVQVVSLTKWKGFFFPYPTFGGVLLIKSGAHKTADVLERVFFGKGEFVSPTDMQKHDFLKGQNALSEKVSRLQAQSLKFVGGFSDPLPWNMKTAVKIPDLDKDQNEQPFVTDFNFDDVDVKAYNGLYHWFGLEPVGVERTSLTFSVFVPADGTNVMYYYDHAAKKQGYAGVSAMPLKVQESRKEFDWNVNAAVEFRPYIKDIAGKRRLFFLGTVASKNENGQFDGAATPDLALVDSEYRDVVWIDVKHPSTWEESIYNQLNEAWRASEGIGYYYTKSKDSLAVNSEFTAPHNDSLSIKPALETKKSQIQMLQKKLDSLKALN